MPRARAEASDERCDLATDGVAELHILTPAPMGPRFGGRDSRAVRGASNRGLGRATGGSSLSTGKTTRARASHAASTPASTKSTCRTAGACAERLGGRAKRPSDGGRWDMPSTRVRPESARTSMPALTPSMLGLPTRPHAELISLPAMLGRNRTCCSWHCWAKPGPRASYLRGEGICSIALQASALPMPRHGQGSQQEGPPRRHSQFASPLWSREGRTNQHEE